MGKKIVIMCDLGFDINFDYHSSGGAPFHFIREIDGESVPCPLNTHRLPEDRVCCAGGCCNCDKLNLEPLEE